MPPQPRAAAPDAVVFDFDGVIVHSEPVHLRATQEVLARRGIELLPADYYARYVGLHDADMFTQLAEDRGLGWCSDDLQELLVAKALRFEALAETDAVLVPGAAACVRRTADLAPIAIASGARREEIERLLARVGLQSFFRAIVAAGDTPCGKPAPDPFAAAAARLGARPARSIAVEDTSAGLASAKGAGLRAIGITTTFPASKLSLADRIVTSMDEITPELLRSLL